MEPGAIQQKIRRSPAAKTAIGVGVIVGGFLIFHQVNKWWTERKIRKLREAAINGQISTRTFLEETLKAGQPVDPSLPKVTVQEATRLPCTSVFPPAMAGAFPGFDQAIAELRRNGTCL